MSGFAIEGRPVGPGRPVYIIADLSGNHLGDYDRAKQLVNAAAEAGADAVKLQTYTPESMTINAEDDRFRVADGGAWSGRKLFDLYSEAHTPWEWHAGLKSLAEGRGLHLFSTPFDTQAADFLQELHVPVIKIASFELVDIPLLEHIGAMGLPVILSTGMGTQEEIDEAVATLIGSGCSAIALLKCTSAYPAPASEMNLRAIQTLEERYQVVTGLSDHSPGVETAIAAVALGAQIVEKHLTLSRSEGGPDAEYSLEPDEFAMLCRAIRNAEQALGTGKLGPAPSEDVQIGLRRSLFATRDIEAGELFTTENVRCVRPGDGLHPRYLETVVKSRAAVSLTKGTPLSWDVVLDSAENESRGEVPELT